MRRTVFKSKIHRAKVTSTDIDYEGSLTVDERLLQAADILPYEQIHVWDVTNGSRLVTYALPGPAGSGVVQVNGGGAHHVKTGDLIIIATFTTMSTKRARKYRPTVVLVDSSNRVKRPNAVSDESSIVSSPILSTTVATTVVSSAPVVAPAVAQSAAETPPVKSTRRKKK